MSESDAAESVSEVQHANGGVEIEDAGESDLKTVTLICEGCGEVMDEVTMFPDKAEEIRDSRPVHDSITCERKAREVLEA